MPDMLYVGLQEDNRIAVFAVDGDSGRLTRRADVAAAGGPSVTAIGPDRNTLYVGCRERPSIASYRIDPATGDLSLLGTTAQADAPTFLAPDRTGRYMLCAYYQGGYAAVCAIAANGTIGAAAIDTQKTAIGAHAIAAGVHSADVILNILARRRDPAPTAPIQPPDALRLRHAQSPIAPAMTACGELGDG